ncbi:MAG: TlpA family protein disulfide reductase [Proteobacteria bacterium]|nr:TlpA family protein disulfide reductase [Pseudomonadota bacterium]
MRSRAGLAAGFFFLAICAASCGGAPPGGGTASSTPSTPSSGSVSDFTLDDVDGRAHSLSSYLGKNVILVSFWATWCEPCKKEMEQLQTLYDAHKDKGLMILSISMDEPETQGDARPFVKQRGFTFPVLLDAETLVTNQLNPRRAAPFSLIIGRDQKIVWDHEGYVPGDEKKVEAAVLEALGLAQQ